MNIALLTDGIFPYAIGGMQKHSYHLAKYLAGNGHTVYLFHCNESKYDVSKLEFFTPEERRNIKPYLIPFPHKSYFPLHYISESKEYSKLIYNQLLPLLPKTDFVFAQGFCAWYLLEHRPENCPPVAVHFHGLEMFQDIPSFKTKVSSIFLRAAVKKNLELCDYAISYGGRITYLLAGLVPVKKIWEVPGNVEETWLTDTVHPVKEKVNFIYLGRYERRKGIEELNKALALIKQDNYTICFVGDIPQSKKLLKDNIHYLGKLSSENEIKKALSSADVLVAPSYAEGMPVSIMEAMAQGLAIIATSVGAVPVLVGNNNGWLLSSPEPQLTADAMLNAIKNKDSLTAKKEASVKKIREGFLLQHSIGKLVALMQETIKNRYI